MRHPLHLLVLLATVGCDSDPITFGGTQDAAPEPAAILYHEDVAPILAERCMLCHSDDEETRSAPFSLTSYDDAFKWGEAGILAYAVEHRIMPPYAGNDDGECGDLKDSLWLTQEEIDTIVGWVDGGMAEGDPGATPQIPDPPTGITDPTVEMITPPYAPDNWISDDLHCFVIDPGLAEDMYLTHYEVLPDTPGVNHHGILFRLNSPTAVAEAEALEAADPDAGYDCFGGSGVSDSDIIAGWVPGIGAQTFPAQSGVLVKANTKLVLQMHNNYEGNGMALIPSEVKVKLKLTESVAEEGQFVGLVHHQLSVEAGKEYEETSKTITAPAKGKVWGVLPHMHYMGRTLTIERDSNECLFRAENYDFDWQRYYWYEEPLTVNAGDELSITCGYDTRGAEGQVVWGEGSGDEMCIAYLYVTR